MVEDKLLELHEALAFLLAGINTEDFPSEIFKYELHTNLVGNLHQLRAGEALIEAWHLHLSEECLDPWLLVGPEH